MFFVLSLVLIIRDFVFAQYFTKPSFEDETRFTTVLLNTRLHGHTIATMKNLIEVECLFESSRQTGSGSVNYNANDKICEINMAIEAATKENDLKNIHGWTYYEKNPTKV